jgi:hypothetical protein
MALCKTFNSWAGQNPTRVVVPIEEDEEDDEDIIDAWCNHED